MSEQKFASVYSGGPIYTPDVAGAKSEEQCFEVRGEPGAVYLAPIEKPITSLLTICDDEGKAIHLNIVDGKLECFGELGISEGARLLFEALATMMPERMRAQ